MTKASDDAFELARTLIAEAKASGATGLDLSEAGGALYAVPEEIAELTGITTLGLLGTRVSDLTPIASLTGLTTLNLLGTPVSDLTPITSLTGITTLYLTHTHISDLTPIAGLTGITSLDLSMTQVSDLTPIASLTGLTTLDLTGTQISDLTPIAGMRGLAEDPGLLGLRFSDTPATRGDARLAEIAEIEDNAERALRLSDYLGFGWTRREGPKDAPEPDTLLASILINGKLDLAPDPPTEAERNERLKRVIHERLREHAGALARLAGNAFARLASKARVLDTLVNRDFETLDLLAIHLEVDDLEARRVLGKEDGAPFTEEVLAALSDVTRAGPGLTLGHPDVDLFIARVRQARETPEPEADAQVHDALSKAIIADPEANGPRSIAMEQRALDAPDPAAKQALQEPKQRNLLILLGRAVRSLVNELPKVVVTGVAFGAARHIGDNLLGPPVEHFLVTNWPLVLEVAHTYGASFAGWFTSAMEPLMLRLGVQEWENFRNRRGQDGRDHP